MTTPLTVYLIRHGQTEFNASGRVQGWLDVPLDDVGRKQADLLGQRFAGRKLSAIYSSPLSRAADTANAIARTTSAMVALDERLREYHMGDWSGLTGDEINASTPGLRWDGAEPPIPNGESAQQMHERIDAFLRDLLSKHHGGETIVAVSHGGTLGAIVGAMLRMPVLRRQPFTFGNTAITKTIYEHNQWRLRSLNDLCHLHRQTESLSISS